MSDQIEVERTGITVGWRVAVLIAAAVFGLYVSKVVAPIHGDLQRLSETQKTLQSKLDKVADELVRVQSDDNQAHGQVNRLDQEVLLLKQSLERQQEEQLRFWRSLTSPRTGNAHGQ